MNKIILFVGMVWFLSGCAIYSDLTTNVNNHSTEVVLTENNFRVVEDVIGEATASYVFGIGGLTTKNLTAEARKNMLSKANMIGSSKALINETLEIRRSKFPFFGRYRVIVSGQIIEFTK